MHYYFESEREHCFIVDFCPGGELFTHVHSKGKIKEHIAKKLIA